MVVSLGSGRFRGLMKNNVLYIHSTTDTIPQAPVRELHQLHLKLSSTHFSSKKYIVFEQEARDPTQTQCHERALQKGEMAMFL